MTRSTRTEVNSIMEKFGIPAVAHDIKGFLLWANNKFELTLRSRDYNCFSITATLVDGDVGSSIILRVNDCLTDMQQELLEVLARGSIKPSLSFVQWGPVDFLASHYPGDREELFQVAGNPESIRELSDMISEAVYNNLQKYPVNLNIEAVRVLMAGSKATLGQAFDSIPKDLELDDDEYLENPLWFLLTW